MIFWKYVTSNSHRILGNNQYFYHTTKLVKPHFILYFYCNTVFLYFLYLHPLSFILYIVKLIGKKNKTAILVAYIQLYIAH